MAFLVCTCAEQATTAATKHGMLKGTRTTLRGKPLESYLGIPYAEPPTGPLRFLKPVPAKPWGAELDATEPRASCIQPGVPFLTLLSETSEDCLYLNVWTPGREGSRKPVLVWIHGGGFYFGSSYQDMYNGSVLAATQDFVVVTINYRLGVMGFLAADVDEAPGNMGLYDQQLALQWVRDNIDGFGGDPEKVTLFGESAGSISVHAHIISPLSSGLFHRAVTMSGTTYMPHFIEGNEEMVQRSNNFARAVGCTNGTKDLGTHPSQVLECMRSLTAGDLLVKQEELLPLPGMKFHPIYRENFIPGPPCLALTRGRFRNVDVLAGVTEDEGSFPFLLHPDKRLLDESLEQFGEEELEGAVRSVLLSVSSEIEGNMWKLYEDKVSPADWKYNYRKAGTEYIADKFFKCPHALVSDRLSARGNAVYSYVFGHRSQKSPFPEWVGVPHTSDIAYVFGIPLQQPDRYTDEDRDFSEEVMTIIATFASDGVPKLPYGETWPKYSSDSPVSVYLKPGNFTTVQGHDRGMCDRWREYTC